MEPPARFENTVGISFFMEIKWIDVFTFFYEGGWWCQITTETDFILFHGNCTHISLAKDKLRFLLKQRILVF